MSSRKKFYIVSIWVPVIVPLIVFLVSFVDNHFLDRALHSKFYLREFNYFIKFIVWMIWGTWQYGALPYTFFASYQTARIAKINDDRVIQNKLLKFPIKFAAFIFIFYWPFTITGNAAFAGVAALFVGYIYYFILLAIEALLYERGSTKPEKSEGC